MGSSICLNCSTSACTIAELQQQLADAEDAMRALACQLSAGGYNSTDFEPKVFYEKINWGIGEMIQRQLKLEQQLADARLLARAFVQARLEVNGWKGEDVVLEAWIPNGQHADGDELINREFWRTQIQDGLPVLCDAWRDALRKAIGET